MKGISKYLLFSDYFLVIARRISQYSIILARWTILLFSKNKEISSGNISHITKPIFQDQLIEIILDFENVLWLECHFKNPRKLYRTKNLNNDFIISSSADNSILENEIEKLVYIGSYIKTTNNHIKFWNKFSTKDEIYIIAKGFNKRKCELSIEINTEHKVVVNSITLNNKKNFSLKNQNRIFSVNKLNNVFMCSNKKLKIKKNDFEFTGIKSFKFSNKNPKPNLTPFIKSNYL